MIGRDWRDMRPEEFDVDAQPSAEPDGLFDLTVELVPLEDDLFSTSRHDDVDTPGGRP